MWVGVLVPLVFIGGRALCRGGRRFGIYLTNGGYLNAGHGGGRRGLPGGRIITGGVGTAILCCDRGKGATFFTQRVTVCL